MAAGMVGWGVTEEVTEVMEGCMEVWVRTEG